MIFCFFISIYEFKEYEITQLTKIFIRSSLSMSNVHQLYSNNLLINLTILILTIYVIYIKIYGIYLINNDNPPQTKQLPTSTCILH